MVKRRISSVDHDRPSVGGTRQESCDVRPTPIVRCAVTRRRKAQVHSGLVGVAHHVEVRRTQLIEHRDEIVQRSVTGDVPPFVSVAELEIQVQ
jgi:hypothetical protein